MSAKREAVAQLESQRIAGEVVKGIDVGGEDLTGSELSGLLTVRAREDPVLATS